MGVVNMTVDSTEILVQSLLQEAVVSSSVMGRDVHSLTSRIKNISLSTTASPTFQDALKDSFGEAVMAFDKPEQCEFPSSEEGPMGPRRS